MSYCVNCGVELDDSAKTCALCDTPVYHPNRQLNEEAPTPFPQEVKIPAGKIGKYRASIASLILMIPNLICIPVNYFITPDANWAIYVVATSILFWIFFLLPFFIFPKKRSALPYISLSMDGLIAAAYIYIMYWLNSSGTWFYRIALPIIAVFVLLGICTIVFFTKKKRPTLRKFSFGLTMIALFSAAIEIIFLISMPSRIVDCVMLTIFFTSAVTAIFFRFASESKQFRAWISRRFFL